jgi:hypothetical protein
MTPLATSIDNLDRAVQEQHARRPDVPPHFAAYHPEYPPWLRELQRRYAVLDEATPRHSHMNPGIDPHGDVASEALRKARRFARKLDPRFDDETESACNAAVVAALDQWRRDNGVGDFDKLLQSCVFRRVKNHLRNSARRDERTTRFSDLPTGMIQ